jgi:hypothetical protein
MKNAIAGLCVLFVTAAVPVFAEDGQVADSTLSALGLGGMQTISDAEGMEVRGMSSSALTMGTSLIFGQIIDPDTKSFVAGSDVSMARSFEKRHGKGISSAKHVTGSALEMELEISSKLGKFEGELFGVAGGHGSTTNFIYIP